MFMIHLANSHNIGETHPCRIDGKPTTITLRDARTLVIGGNDAREIVHKITPPGSDLTTYICADAD